MFYSTQTNSNLEELFKTTTGALFSGDGLDAYGSSLITFTPPIPSGYKIHSFKCFYNDTGTFIASVSAISDTNITLRICNYSNIIMYPGNMYCEVILIKNTL